MELPIRVREPAIAKVVESTADHASKNVSMLLQMLRIYPIRQQLLPHLGIAEIISLTRTCAELSSLYRDVKGQRWDINRRLKRFVDDPQGFRSVMASCDALISGSFTLQFFEGVDWEEFDLEVFVNDVDVEMKTFSDYLTQVEGYELEVEVVEPSGYDEDSPAIKV